MTIHRDLKSSRMQVGSKGVEGVKQHLQSAHAPEGGRLLPSLLPACLTSENSDAESERGKHYDLPPLSKTTQAGEGPSGHCGAGMCISGLLAAAPSTATGSQCLTCLPVGCTQQIMQTNRQCPRLHQVKAFDI